MNSRLRDGYVGTRERAQLLRTTSMLLSTRATVENHSQTIRLNNKEPALKFYRIQLALTIK